MEESTTATSEQGVSSESESAIEGSIESSEAQTSEFDMEKFLGDNKDKLSSFFTELMKGNTTDNTPDKATDSASDPTMQMFEAKAKELEEKEKQLNLERLQIDTAKLLEAKDIPVSVMEFVISENLEATQKRIDRFSDIFDKAVQVNVMKRLAGKTPSYSSGNSNSIPQAQQQVRNIMSGR